MRERLVSDLTREILGPRNGPEETFPHKDEPKNEFMLGQLYPPEAVDLTPESDAEMLGDSAAGDDESDDSPGSGVAHTGLKNFRRFPSSIGISFSLKNVVKDGDLKLCATWARYSLNSDGKWERRPRVLVVTPSSGDQSFVDDDKEITLGIRCSKLSKGDSKLMIYLSTNLRPERTGSVRTPEIIFQPEIRVIIKNSNPLVEVGEGGFSSEDEEWKIATRQYMNRPIFARGHMCGAYWSAIDPQQNINSSEQAPFPFTWTDGDYLKKEKPELDEFFHPTIRTDFLPMYAVSAPIFDWDSNFTPEPDFVASHLADSDSFDDFKSKLYPLVKHYNVWIDAERKKVSSNWTLCRGRQENNFEARAGT